MAVPKKWIAVNAHATDPLSNGTADAVYVGGAGNVVCRFDDAGTDTTIPAVAGGYVLGRVTHVRATSTATSMFALYN